MSTQSLFNAPPLQFPLAQTNGNTNTNVSASPAADSANQAQAQVPQTQAQAPAQTPAALTLAEVRDALPQHLRTSISQSVVDLLNNVTADPIILENIRNNFFGYSSVLKEGRFKTTEYVNAVTYVSYKLMGCSNEDAYAGTFPQRYARLVAKGTSKKDINAYVSAYHRGKLVNLIMEQSLVPTWVLNQDLHQKAINHLATLMMTARSEKVQSDAAIGLLNALKKPETKNDFQLNINTEESQGMKEMRSMLAQLAQQQRDLIESGHSKTIDVAATPLINREEAEDV